MVHKLFAQYLILTFVTTYIFLKILHNDLKLKLEVVIKNNRKTLKNQWDKINNCIFIGHYMNFNITQNSIEMYLTNSVNS